MTLPFPKSFSNSLALVDKITASAINNRADSIYHLYLRRFDVIEKIEREFFIHRRRASYYKGFALTHATYAGIQRLQDKLSVSRAKLKNEYFDIIEILRQVSDEIDFQEAKSHISALYASAYRSLTRVTGSIRSLSAALSMVPIEIDKRLIHRKKIKKICQTIDDEDSIS